MSPSEKSALTQHLELDIKKYIDEASEARDAALEASLQRSAMKYLAGLFLMVLTTVGGITYFAGGAKGEVRENRNAIMSIARDVETLQAMVERMARFETAIAAIDSRTRRIEGQLDTIYRPERRAQPE